MAGSRQKQEGLGLLLCNGAAGGVSYDAGKSNRIDGGQVDVHLVDFGLFLKLVPGYVRLALRTQLSKQRLILITFRRPRKDFSTETEAYCGLWIPTQCCYQFPSDGLSVAVTIT